LLLVDVQRKEIVKGKRDGFIFFSPDK